jgi:hypothetical protein
MTMRSFSVTFFFFPETRELKAARSAVQQSCFHKPIINTPLWLWCHKEVVNIQTAASAGCYHFLCRVALDGNRHDGRVDSISRIAAIS